MTDHYPHNDEDCHGTRCPDCKCCMHSDTCESECCHDYHCGCFGSTRALRIETP